MSITKEQAKELKKSILDALTEDDGCGNSLFDKKEGFDCFNGTNLDMVMQAVVYGIHRRVE